MVETMVQLKGNLMLSQASEGDISTGMRVPTGIFPVSSKSYL